MSLFLGEFWGFLWFNPLNREVWNGGSSTWCCTTFQQSWNSLYRWRRLPSCQYNWALSLWCQKGFTPNQTRILTEELEEEDFPDSKVKMDEDDWSREIGCRADTNFNAEPGINVSSRNLKSLRCRGSVATWSAFRTPVVPGSSLALTTSWVCFSVAPSSNPRPRL